MKIPMHQFLYMSLLRGGEYVKPYFLHSKDLVIEILLQLFIGKVDTKLLKAVVFKVLKAKDVQNAWEIKGSDKI